MRHSLLSVSSPSRDLRSRRRRRSHHHHCLQRWRRRRRHRKLHGQFQRTETAKATTLKRSYLEIDRKQNNLDSSWGWGSHIRCTKSLCVLVALSILMLVRLAKEILWRGDILHQRRRRSVRATRPELVRPDAKKGEGRDVEEGGELGRSRMSRGTHFVRMNFPMVHQVMWIGCIS